MRLGEVKVGTILTDDASRPKTAFIDIEVIYISQSENNGEHFFVLKWGDGSLSTYEWSELEKSFAIYEKPEESKELDILKEKYKLLNKKMGRINQAVNS
jgi:hypothetical protein